MLSDLLRYLAKKKILILGYGREGRSSWAFLEKHQETLEATITIADLKEIPDPPAEATVVTGPHYLETMRGQDLVLKAPGISFRDFTILREDKITLAEFPGTEISGQMDLFLRFTPAHVIGVSGTKGKSTTTSLCYEILRRFTADSYLLGNIGVPVLDHFEAMSETTYCAVEMSSHQLEFVTASPEVAVLTNFYPEHLDHYRDYDQYLEAKLNILRYQTSADTAVLSSFEETLIDKALAEVRGNLYLVRDSEIEDYYPSEAPSPTKTFTLGEDLGEGLQFSANEETYTLPTNPALLGRHVYRDALLALAATSALGVPLDLQLAAIAEFPGIAHRLEPIGEVDGVRYYNDSIATIPQATILALEALATVGPVTTLLVGGMDRGLDYSAFVEELRRFPIRNLICLPDTGAKIKALASKYFTCTEVESMREAVALAKAATRKGEICLLSPAASSYNRYKNFEERGEDFREQVLGKNGL